MNENFESVREKQLLNYIPDVYDYLTLLNIGGHFHVGRNLQMLPHFMTLGYIIDIVEVYEPNYRDLLGTPGIRRVFHSDVMDFEPNDEYDISFFWHGVEHLDKKQVPILLKKMRKYTNQLIIFATPYGRYEQGAEYGNPFEIHKSHWYPGDFKELGMEVSAIGLPDRKQGNIIAWQRLT